MKKSLIWITAGVAAIGFGVPAFAAHGDSPSDTVPTQAPVVAAVPVASIDDNVRSSGVDDNATRNSVDDNVTTNSVDDNVTVNSVDDSATVNSVEDISGPCDEAEHANDPLCTGATVTSTDDNGSHDANDDSSGRHGGNDDSGHGSDDD